MKSYRKRKKNTELIFTVIIINLFNAISLFDYSDFTFAVVFVIIDVIVVVISR
jgi:hypothetical protein